jgi:hypothetical protein
VVRAGFFRFGRWVVVMRDGLYRVVSDRYGLCGGFVLVRGRLAKSPSGRPLCADVFLRKFSYWRTQGVWVADVNGRQQP